MTKRMYPMIPLFALFAAVLADSSLAHEKVIVIPLVGNKMGTVRTFGADSTTVSAGTYKQTNLCVVDRDLTAGNIKSGVTIFGITGDSSVVNTSDGDAVAEDMLWGKTAYVQGVQVTGTITPQTLSDSSETVSAGYYDGTTLRAVDTDLAAGNIKSGTSIFGITGTFPLYPAPVARSGQTLTVPFAAPAGSDGALQQGTAWPSPRFTNNADGTVTDNLTGLVWLQNANCTDTVGGIDKSSGMLSWADAITWSNNLAGIYNDCGLSDDSPVGAWRLPNLKELSSLLAMQYTSPMLTNDAGTGHWGNNSSSSFINVQSQYTPYWTSTTGPDRPTQAIYIDFGSIDIYMMPKTYINNVWPVRN